MAINAIPEMCYILKKVCIQKHSKHKNQKMYIYKR